MKDFNDFLKTNNIKKASFYHILTKDLLENKFFSPRESFSHKGTYGHCLLIAGSYTKGGACVLCSKATLRSGCGLLSVHIPQLLYDIMQISVPEAMVEIDNDKQVFASHLSTEKYSAIAIGPGLDTKQKTKHALVQLLKENTKPIIIDADGLNLLSSIQNFKSLLQEDTILTPHPKEFERLFGRFSSYKDKLDFMREFSMQIGVTIILKGGITAISTKTGEIFFNVIGNAGMATAGSGDVLTGILLGILSQGYTTRETAKLGVYLHALAGDFAAKNLCMQSLIASDIISFLPNAIKHLQNNNSNN